MKNSEFISLCKNGKTIMVSGKHASVLFFIQSLSGGGAERATANMANYWVEHGRVVWVVTIASPESDCYALHSNIRRIALYLEDDNRSSWYSLRIKWQTVRALRALLKELRPNVAIGMMEDAGIILGIASVGLNPLTTIGAERTYPPYTSFTKKHWKLLRNYGYGLLDVVTTQTAEGKEWIEKHTKVRRVIAIPNVLSWPLPRLNPTVVPDAVIPPGAKVLLSIGRFTPEKQYALLIQVFRVIADDFPNWVLVLLGDGSDRALLEQLVHQYRLENRVLLPGRAGNPGDWYTAADLFVLSSAFEGFPNVLLEAMAYGKAVVSFDCKTGPSELIQHEQNGLLVEDGNAEALELALARCMDDEALRLRLGKKAAEVQLSHATDRIMSIWEELMDRIEL